MSRRWILALMVVVVAVVVAVFVIDLRHDRQLLLDGFLEERIAATRELAVEVGARFGSVRKDVLFFKYLLEHSALAGASPEVFHSQIGERFRRELRAMLEVVPPYKEMQVIGPNGSVALAAREPKWAPGADQSSLQRALNAAALLAPSLPEGQVRVSAPIHRAGHQGDSPGYRIFYTSVHVAGGRGAVMLLIEPDYLFGALRAFHSLDHPGFALLNIDADRVGFASSQKLKGLAFELRSSSGLTPIGEALHQNEVGRIELPSEASKRLGLGSFSVMTYARIPHVYEWRWALTAFSSGQHLYVQQRAVLFRTVVAMAAVLAGLTALGALLLRQVRREAELNEKLRTANEIRHLHELSEKILNNVPSGLLAIGKDARVLQANGAVRAMSASARPGATLAEAFPAAAAEVVESVRQLLAEAVTARAASSLLFERVALFSERPGTYQVLAVPLETALHGVEALLIIEDLSELKRLELELVRAEKLSTMGILAAGIAHEVGTPLGVVRARAEHLLGRPGVDAPQARSLQAIVDQCDIISRIIRQVLEFSRVRGVQAQAVPVGAAVREAVELLRERFAHAGVQLKTKVSAGCPDLNADPDALRQVLLNLLRNACDACNSGGEVEVRACGEKDGANERVRVEVRDTGCGIPAENMHAIFDPFFTTKKGGEGVGLGLAIAQDVVKNHGGTLSVKSEPDKGSVFTLTWPAAGEVGPALQSAMHEGA